MYTCIDNYVDMQDTYVDMQDIHVYMQDNYVFSAAKLALAGFPLTNALG